mmetsp:Transcript_86592/g.232174  ORF Transcript_86592/g.232174 Transcript_86592/m.232174 type:complete len:484 (-) Transcript_86592:1732-3183(-)
MEKPDHRGVEGSMELLEPLGTLDVVHSRKDVLVDLHLQLPGELLARNGVNRVRLIGFEHGHVALVTTCCVVLPPQVLLLPRIHHPEDHPVQALVPVHRPGRLLEGLVLLRAVPAPGVPEGHHHHQPAQGAVPGRLEGGGVHVQDARALGEVVVFLDDEIGGVGGPGLLEPALVLVSVDQEAIPGVGASLVEQDAEDTALELMVAQLWDHKLPELHLRPVQPPALISHDKPKTILGDGHVEGGGVGVAEGEVEPHISHCLAPPAQRCHRNFAHGSLSRLFLLLRPGRHLLRLLRLPRRGGLGLGLLLRRLLLLLRLSLGLPGLKLPLLCVRLGGVRRRRSHGTRCCCGRLLVLPLGFLALFLLFLLRLLLSGGFLGLRVQLPLDPHHLPDVHQALLCFQLLQHLLHHLLPLLLASLLIVFLHLGAGYLLLPDVLGYLQDFFARPLHSGMLAEELEELFLRRVGARVLDHLPKSARWDVVELGLV